MTKRESNPHLLVVDWNVLRAMPKDAEELPRRYGVLIADAMMHEIIGSDNPAGFIEKLERILAGAVHERLYVGKYWEKIAEKEQPRTLSSRQDVIEWRITSDLQSHLAYPTERWAARIQGSQHSPEHVEYERLKQRFVDNCEAFAIEARKKFGLSKLKEMRSNPQLLKEVIRKPDIAVGIATTACARLDTSEWQRVLTRFPDSHAAGRWWRIIVWYALQRAMQEGSKQGGRFENNWDDAHYGFLASYTGRLVTKDAGLKQMVGAIFRSVRVTDEMPKQNAQ